MDIDERRDEFKRNQDLEEYIWDINYDLQICEKELLNHKIREYPIVFIMGAMRSGTTLMLQWLASTGEFVYPSNIISRFYKAPIIGSKIQRLLTDPKFNFRNEILDFSGDISFESNNGKTQGALEPNEFWYFWRRFLPDNLWLYSSTDLMKKVDIQLMSRELWGISQVYDKPLAIKAMICNYHIPFLNNVFPKAIFIAMQRDIERHITSVLEARRRQFGTYNKWYSFRIPEYEELIQIPEPKLQVKRQIECINNAVSEGLKVVPEQKKIQIDYEKFCENPEVLYYEIQKKLKNLNYNISEKYRGKRKFSMR